jgi:CDGSH-type Zn-finger protein/uncharacterized Fe-S cluster protein YjdI
MPEKREMSDKVRHYADEEIDITYDSRRCIHAAECIRGLPAVFNTARRPWILPTGAGADAIAAVIAKCPTGALHFTRRDSSVGEVPPENNTIVPTSGGPLYVRGRVQLRSADGTLIVEDARLALCRCGQSHNKPFCDNSHRDAGFDDPGAVADGGAPAETNGGLSLTASANGPLLAQGPFVLRGAVGDGRHEGTKAALCRCGASRNKPFCDGTHQQISFRSSSAES